MLDLQDLSTNSTFWPNGQISNDMYIYIRPTYWTKEKTDNKYLNKPNFSPWLFCKNYSRIFFFNAWKMWGLYMYMYMYIVHVYPPSPGIYGRGVDNFL